MQKEKKMVDQSKEIKGIETGLRHLGEKASELNIQDMDKLQTDLRYILVCSNELGNHATNYLKNIKESIAKKKISNMIEKGYSFSHIKIDNMVFSITDSGEINRCYSVSEEPYDLPD